MSYVGAPNNFRNIPMKSKMTLIAGVFGNALEWYDFTIYAFFAPILATLFFPSKDPFVSLILTFSVFAAGFLVRPVGAIFFGYVGDHFGRRKALILSIIVMSLPTVLLALTPSHAQIGIAAPIIFTILRLFQGTAISGELTTAIAFLVEHAAANRRGLAGSLAMCSAIVGIVFSSIVATVLTDILNPDALAAWGWRIAFALGGIIGLIGLVIRIMSHETALYHQTKERYHVHASLIEHLIKLNWKMVGVATLLTCVMAIGNYFLIAYFNTFMIKELGLSIRATMTINLFSLILFTILIPIMGYLSDHIGRKRVLGTGMIGLILFCYPIFWLLTQKSVEFALMGEVFFAIVLSPVTSLIPTMLAELFETRYRNTSLSIGYNLSLALFGGTAPLVALALVKYTNNYFSPAYYLMSAAVVSFIVLLSVKESYKDKLV